MQKVNLNGINLNLSISALFHFCILKPWEPDKHLDIKEGKIKQISSFKKPLKKGIITWEKYATKSLLGLNSKPCPSDELKYVDVEDPTKYMVSIQNNFLLLDIPFYSQTSLNSPCSSWDFYGDDLVKPVDINY